MKFLILTNYLSDMQDIQLALEEKLELMEKTQQEYLESTNLIK